MRDHELVTIIVGSYEFIYGDLSTIIALLYQPPLVYVIIKLTKRKISVKRSFFNSVLLGQAILVEGHELIRACPSWRLVVDIQGQSI